MSDELQPQLPTKERTLLTAYQFIEVMKTGKTDGYEAEIHFLDHILIKDIEVKEKIWVEASDIFDSSITLSTNCVFNEQFFVLGGIFNRHFIIYGAEFRQSVMFNQSRFHQDFTILGGMFDKDLRIINCEFDWSSMINGGTFRGEFHINNGSFKNSFTIAKSPSFLNGLNIVEVKKIPQLRLTDLTLNFDIKVARTNIHKLEIANLNNKGGLDIHDTSINNIFIQNSHISNTSFIGCNWVNSTLLVDNSRIIDLFYTNTVFPKEILSNKEGKEKYKQVIDTYGQLKAVADRQNDRESALYFQAQANQNLMKLKRLQVESWYNVRHPDWAEWFQLWLSRVSSNYGTDYIRATIGLLLTTLILFLIYIPCSTDDLAWSLDISQWGKGFKGLWSHMHHYWTFLNPTRRPGLICGTTGDQVCGGSSLFLDWFSRIVIAYFVYQIIISFRKYSKR